MKPPNTTGILSTGDSTPVRAQEWVQPWLGKYNVISPQKGECISMALAVTSIKARCHDNQSIPKMIFTLSNPMMRRVVLNTRLPNFIGTCRLS
jgi:hypothetical protein